MNIALSDRDYTFGFFDSAYTWLIPIPLVFALVTFTDLPVLAVYICAHIADLIKFQCS